MGSGTKLGHPWGQPPPKAWGPGCPELPGAVTARVTVIFLRDLGAELHGDSRLGEGRGFPFGRWELLGASPKKLTLGLMDRASAGTGSGLLGGQVQPLGSKLPLSLGSLYCLREGPTPVATPDAEV